MLNQLMNALCKQYTNYLKINNAAGCDGSDELSDNGRFVKSNLSLYSLYFTKACNEFAGPIFASLHQRNTAFFEKMSQRWRAVGNRLLSNLTAQDLNLRPLTLETHALLLDQLTGFWLFVL